MSKGIPQPDGTNCYSGPTCRKHGAYNASVLNKHENLDPNTIFTGRHVAASKQRDILKKSKELIHSLPLKDMEASLLTHAILDKVMELKNVDYEKVAASIELAAYLHRTDTRANRKDLPRTPYIEHPLRNTLRAMRYGCTDEATIITGVLHDTVEDHSFDIAREFAGVETDDPYEARAIALTYISDAYGEEVGFLVKEMSNPITPDGMSKQEKRESYWEHMAEAIRHPKVALGKYCDLGDNAFSLHHTDAVTYKSRVYNMALKYSVALEIMSKRLQEDASKRRIPVSDEGYAKMLPDLQAAQARIKTILATPQ